MKRLHHDMNLFFSRLSEQQKRWYTALESTRLGHGGDNAVSQITGMDVKTIRRGRLDMESSLKDRPLEGVRLEGGGRPPVEKKTPPSWNR